MMISTKGRYALRVMLDLAQRDPEGFNSLKDIAARQEISLKYLEAIVSTLSRAGFVESQRGKMGGYRLMRTPSQYHMQEILQMTEGTLAPVSCLDGEGGCADCTQSPDCLTMPLWKGLDRLVGDYLEKITLQDLLDRKYTIE